MAISPLAKKLGIKPGHRVMLMNPNEGAPELLNPLPEGAELKLQSQGEYDAVLLFAQDRAELARYAPATLSAVKPGGLLWIAFPKGSSKRQTDLTRDQGWEVVTEAGMETVALVSVDEVWSAFRFRPCEMVKRRIGAGIA